MIIITDFFSFAKKGKEKKVKWKKNPSKILFFMDVGLSISAKKESQLLCCIMGKRCHFDVTFWLIIVGD